MLVQVSQNLEPFKVYERGSEWGEVKTLPDIYAAVFTANHLTYTGENKWFPKNKQLD